MRLTIAQSSKYQGNDYWKWSVWLEGPSEMLDRVDKVTYYLHRTFPNPVRIVETRRTKFRLNAAGWGGFSLVAKITDKDGCETRLEHEVVLKYPDKSPTKA
jgi:transcription initiation factor IIF auxiliary subunit